MLCPSEGRGPGHWKAELCGLPLWTRTFAGAHITVVSFRSFFALVIPGLTRDPAFLRALRIRLKRDPGSSPG